MRFVLLLCCMGATAASADCTCKSALHKALIDADAAQGDNYISPQSTLLMSTFFQY